MWGWLRGGAGRGGGGVGRCRWVENYNRDWQIPRLVSLLPFYLSQATQHTQFTLVKITLLLTLQLYFKLVRTSYMLP